MPEAWPDRAWNCQMWCRRGPSRTPLYGGKYCRCPRTPLHGGLCCHPGRRVGSCRSSPAECNQGRQSLVYWLGRASHCLSIHAARKQLPDSDKSDGASWYMTVWPGGTQSGGHQPKLGRRPKVRRPGRQMKYWPAARVAGPAASAEGRPDGYVLLPVMWY